MALTFVTGQGIAIHCTASWYLFGTWTR